MLRTSKGVGLMLTLLTMVSSGLVRAEVVVIGHPTLPVSELDPQKVKDIWLGKIKHLAGNVPVRPIDQSPNSKVRDEFYMKSLDKSPQQVKAYWARITFTGKDNAPLTFNDDATGGTSITLNLSPGVQYYFVTTAFAFPGTEPDGGPFIGDYSNIITGAGNVTLGAVPEPGMALACAALAGLVMNRRRRG